MANSSEASNKPLHTQLVEYILERKNVEAASILKKTDQTKNLIDDNGSTLLHYAADYGNIIMTKYLIGIGCNIDHLNKLRKTPLMLAVDRGHRKIMEILLKSGACRSQEVIEHFLENERKKCCDDDTIMAKNFVIVGYDLIKVIGLNRPGITKVMLEMGCSVDGLDENGDTTLHLAVESMNFENIQLLVWYGVRINAEGYNGRTALFKYDMNYKNTDEKLKILKFLLHRNAFLTKADDFGITPLALFYRNADKNILKIVMEYNFTNNNDNPMHYLKDNKNPGVLQVLQSEIFDIDDYDTEGYTMLMSAVKNCDLEKVDFLLDQNANVNSQSDEGYTPLILAFMMDKQEDENKINDILEILMNCGANPDAKLLSGKTIFDFAAEKDLFYRMKLVITILVMRENDETICEPIVQSVQDKINKYLDFKYHYEKCKQQIEEMKCTYVYGFAVSLFKLMFEEEENLALYARNDEFEGNFKSLMKRVMSMDEYMWGTLNERVNKVIQTAELKRNCALVISKITELPSSARRTILFKIVDYLDVQDLENLLLV